MKKKIIRYISVFNKTDDRHLRDIAFSATPEISQLRSIFNCTESDLMYDEYPIDSRIAAKLAPFLVDDLDIAQFDYFLSCHRDEEKK